MSGHSKWSKIKHKKEVTDKKKGQMFGRMAKEIVIAARSEKDPAKNAALRDVIARAKKVNMPQANIDRLLSNTGKPLTSVLYEVFGPAGSALLVMVETDSTNRTLQELRLILRDHGGNLGEIGTVQWKFKAQASVEAAPIREGQLARPAFDEVELALIDSGAENITVQENSITVIGAPETQNALEETLRRFELNITDSKIEYAPTQPLTITDEADQEKIGALIEALENQSDVLEVFSDA